MKKVSIIIAAILAVATIAVAFWFWQKNGTNDVKIPSPQESPLSQNLENIPEEAPPVQPKNIIFPISDFDNRITLNPFGSYFTGDKKQDIDQKVCNNATTYAGYHTASDLEATAEEASIDVPVLAVANGKIVKVGNATGYGGILVLAVNIDGGDYTAIYGHIDLKSTNLEVGDEVKVGHKLANLAPACSDGNGHTRKHLHFGLHKGSAIDVKGYVASQSELNSWVDPKVLLDNLVAK